MEIVKKSYWYSTIKVVTIFEKDYQEIFESDKYVIIQAQQIGDNKLLIEYTNQLRADDKIE